MNTFSNENNVTKHSEITKKISEYLGISLENTKKVINKKMQLIPHSDVDDFYKKIETYYLGKSENYDVHYYMDLFLQSVEDSGNKNKAFNDVLLELYKKQDATDSINTLSTVKNLLICVNQKDKDKLGKLLTISDDIVDLVKLNESSNFQFNNDVKLNYDGLSDILRKNNPRWRNTNQLNNVYLQINEYVNGKIDDIKSTDAVGYGNTVEASILNEYLNGIISPLNLSYSSNKHVIGNIQSLTLDMIFAINSYITSSNNVDKLNFISNDKILAYKQTANALTELMYSSVPESNLLNKHYVEDIINGVDTGAGNYTNSNSIIDDLTASIHYTETRMLKLNNLFSMLNFIHSASDDFNLKIRVVLKTYINNTHAILTKLNRL